MCDQEWRGWWSCSTWELTSGKRINCEQPSKWQPAISVWCVCGADMVKTMSQGVDLWGTLLKGGFWLLFQVSFVSGEITATSDMSELMLQILNPKNRKGTRSQFVNSKWSSWTWMPFAWLNQSLAQIIWILINMSLSPWDWIYINVQKWEGYCFRTFTKEENELTRTKEKILQ